MAGGQDAQQVVALQFDNAIQAIRAAQFNATHRPKSLLSGLMVCGCCGGPYALRLKGRFACSNHVDTRRCDNSRSIAREALETRVLGGLRDRLMTPEIAAEAVRLCEEANRLNHERSATGAADRAELEKVLKAIRDLVAMVEQGQGRARDRAAARSGSARGCNSRPANDRACGRAGRHPNIAQSTNPAPAPAPAHHAAARCAGSAPMPTRCSTSRPVGASCIISALSIAAAPARRSPRRPHRPPNRLTANKL